MRDISKVSTGFSNINSYTYTQAPCWHKAKQQTVHACRESHHLIVSVFDVVEKRFLAFSSSFQNIFGYNDRDIADEGWNFWYGIIDTSEVEMIKTRLSGFLFHPRIINNSAIFLKYHVRSADGKWHFIKHEIELRTFEREVIAINYICDYSAKEKIDFLLSSTFAHYPQKGSVHVNISYREREVLRLISNGLSSKQIAHHLCISYNTVISHRKNLLEKFRVQNTAQLIKSASNVMRL